MEEPFQIKVKLYGDDQEVILDVTPGEESWLIDLSGVELGTIVNTGEDSWIWKDGEGPLNLDTNEPDQLSADIIGKALESHYM